MPRQPTQEAFTTFIAGLNTEVGELTFPKDASIDELNCLLERDGSRRRRLGVDYETNHSFTSETYNEGVPVYTHIWDNVGGSGGTEFVVVQVGNTIRFYENSISPISNQVVLESSTSSSPYIIDLSTHAVSGSGDARVSVTSINGSLVVVSKDIDPFYISRSLLDGSFTETTIDFRVRDFEWQGPTNNYFWPSSFPSNGRKYDTKNAGWADGPNDVGDDALTSYSSANSGAWPPLTHPWYSAKDSNGDFDTTEFDKIFTGTSRIANGHYIYNLWNIDRTTASGVNNLTTDSETTRFTTTVAYSGRVFYAGLSSEKNSGRVFFSQLLEDIDQMGECLQLNDPTSEVLSDLLDTDGGSILIPEAGEIKKLHVFGPRLIVFASNGIWIISGVDDVFRATEFSISKISEVGIDSLGSFVSASGRPYWWSYNGIHTIAVTEQGGFQEQNISLGTIQSFWDDITPSQKGSMAGVYDSVNNKVFWSYPNSDETVDNKFNNFLIFDEALSAFYPWTINDAETNSPQIVGLSYTRSVGSGTVSGNIIDSSYNMVVDSLGNQVVGSAEGRVDTGTIDIRVVVREALSGSISFGEFSNLGFYDWGTADYDSYADAAFNFQGDMTTYKTTPYVTVYTKRTEEGWSGNDDDGYTLVRPSSLLVSGFVDFKTTASSSAQQAYRHKFPLVVDSSDLSVVDYPSTVISTRLKIRGRGRSYRLRFESESGKDFHLLGWEVIGAKNNAI